MPPRWPPPAGAYPATEILGRGPLLNSGCSDSSWVLLRVPGLAEGCHQLEAQRGVLLSVPQPFLVVDDAAAVVELRQLEQSGCCMSEVAELLLRLGAVLRFAQQHQQRQGGEGSDAAEAADVALVARTAAAAQDLAASCILRGWAAVLRLVMPVACLGCAREAAVAGVEAHLGGIPVLHAAGVSGQCKQLGCWLLPPCQELDRCALAALASTVQQRHLTVKISPPLPPLMQLSWAAPRWCKCSEPGQLQPATRCTSRPAGAAA